MTRHTRFAFLVLLTVTTAGCATMTVGYHTASGANLERYQTWDWGPADALPISDPRLADNAFFKDHLEGAVEKRLASLGFIRAPVGLLPDLLIHYHTSINQRFLINETAANCATGDCQPQTIEYEQGTLVLDVVDTSMNRLVWRGWAQNSIKQPLGNEARLERQINEAVARVFAHFPTALCSLQDDWAPRRPGAGPCSSFFRSAATSFTYPRPEW